MGGYYYQKRAMNKLTPVFEELGVSRVRSIDRVLKVLAKRRIKKRYHVLHLNRYDKELLARDSPKIFTVHGSLDIPDRDACDKLVKISKFVDTIIASTHHSAKTIKETCGIDAEVIHHGIDTEIFNPYIISQEKARRTLKLPLDKKIILWVARIGPEKNLEMALKAMQIVAKERKDVMLLVKGRAINRSYYERIKSLLKEEGAEHLILFDLKWTPNMMMMYYYRAADVYIHTSITEAFGLTVAEAMACGTPVVAYKRSAVPEVVGDAGYLVNSAEELAEKILKILANEKLKRHLGLKAVKRVHEMFTLKSTALKYLHVYDKIA